MGSTVVVVVSEEDSSIVFCYTWVYGEITTVDGNGGQSAFGFCPEEVADPDAEVERGREGAEGAIVGVTSVCVGERGWTEGVREDGEVHEP